MTDRELLQQALDALMRLEQDTFYPAKVFPYKPTMIAIRARLAHPEQEPGAWTVRGLITDFSRDFSAYQTKTYTVPLYTAPPQREWVVLTDEEVEELRHIIDWTAGWSYGNFARAIEAKLKEKNT